MLAFLGEQKLTELESDPRFLIGRLSQALTALIEAEVPPMDATARLLEQAIWAAIAYRHISCAKCGEGYVCGDCEPSWQQAARYEALFDLLGIIGGHPGHHADLKVVDR
jgi:hypothetical protein